MRQLTSEDLLAVSRSPGAQYVLTDLNTPLLEVNAGFWEIPNKSIISSQTTFNAYSTTKTLTAVGIMKLVEQRKISLEEEVNSYFPEFSFSGRFTLLQLLSHQSGIGNPLPLKWIHLTEDDEHFDDRGFANQIISKSTKLSFRPGSKAKYSNVGYLLLGLLLEKISGVTFKEFIRENVFAKTPKVGTLDFKIDPTHHATGYHPRLSFSNLLLWMLIDKHKYMKPCDKSWVAFKNHYVNGKAYGGLIANATGLAEFLRALLKGNLVNENSLMRLFTVQKNNICLSWFKGKLGAHLYYCHPGGGGGYYCEIRVYPELKLSSVIMTNRSGFSDERLLDKIDSHNIP